LSAKTTKFRFLIILATIIMATATLGATLAAPVQANSTNSLNVQLISQWTDVSCWAASGTMIIGYYAHTTMSHGFATKVQQSLAYLMTGNTFGLTHGITLSVFQSVSGAFANAMAQFNVQMVPVWGGLSFGTVVSEIDAGHPIILLYMPSANMGHAVVISGYQQSTGQVLIYDPWPPNSGATYWQSFSSFKQQSLISAFETGATYDFSMSNSGGITVMRGGSGSNVLTVNLMSGSRPQSISLYCSTVPNGASCNFRPSSSNPTFQSTLTISTSASMPSASYVVVVTGTGGGKTRTTQFGLTVNAPFDFSLSNSGGITVTRGSSGSTRITATSTSGSTQPVSLSCGALPTGMSCSFSPQSGYPTYSSTLTLRTTPSTPKGSYTVTVTATGGGKTHTTQFTITVK